MSELVHSKWSRVTQGWFYSSELGSSAESYVQYLRDRGYAILTIDAYVQSVAHFAHWLTLQRLRIAHVNEKLVGGFLDEHLPVCRCAAHCRRARRSVQAALMHLLKLLRISGRIAPEESTHSPAVNKELRDFEHHLQENLPLH